MVWVYEPADLHDRKANHGKDTQCALQAFLSTSALSDFQPVI